MQDLTQAFYILICAHMHTKIINNIKNINIACYSIKRRVSIIVNIL